MRPLPLPAPTAFIGSIKTLAVLLFLPLLALLCCASTAKADPIVITGGFASSGPGNGNISLNLTAPGFIFSAVNTSAAKIQACGFCQPGTGFGGGTVLVNTDLTINFTYNGVVYVQNTNGLGYVARGGGSITYGGLTVPADLSPVSTTFSFVGGVGVTQINRPNPFIPPDNFNVELTGSGIVTFTFVRVGSNIFTQGTFAFAPPEPVPEPATLFLLGTGLFGVVAAKVRRRHKEERFH
jgi:hypothetical protein